MYLLSIVQSVMLVAASSQDLGIGPHARLGDVASEYKDLSLDYDALTEACYTLVAFAAAGAVISICSKRKKTRMAARKAAKLQCEASFCQSPCVPKVETPVLKQGTGALPNSVASTGFRSQCTRPRVVNGRCENSARRTSVTNTSECDHLVAAIRVGKASELPALMDAARTRIAASGADAEELQASAAKHLLSVLRACASHHKFPEALAAYDHAREHIGTGHSNMWSLLLYSAVEAQEFWRCKGLFQNLLAKAEPSNNDFLNMVRYHTHQQDPDGLKHTLAELRAASFSFEAITRNRALSHCFAHEGLQLIEVLTNSDLCDVELDSVGYNTILKGFAKFGQFSHCFEIYDRMRKSSIPQSEVTFGIMLDVCIDAKEFDRAKGIFSDLRSSGLSVNVVHYTTFMKGLVNASQLDAATDLLDEMSKTSSKPDLVTYSTLVKARSDRGEVMEAIKILERMFNQGIRADAIILNIVLTGCCVSAMPKEHVFHVWHWLSTHGLKTTTTTLSILVKALAKSQSWEAALHLLDEAHAKHNIWPETRLYTQLAQACAKAGDGKYVVEAYTAMVRVAALQCIKIDDATHERLQRLCTLCGKSSMASKVRDTAF